MLGDRNTFRPARFDVDGARSLDADDADDRAQEHFGNLIDEPTLVQSFRVAQLPPPPWVVEVKTLGGLKIGALHGVRLAIGWDGAQTFEGPPIETTAGQTVALEVSAPRGNVLEVWADASSPLESDASEIESVQVLSLAAGRKRAGERADAPIIDPKDPIGLKSAGLALALVAVLGLAIWFGIGRNIGGAR